MPIVPLLAGTIRVDWKHTSSMVSFFNSSIWVSEDGCTADVSSPLRQRRELVKPIGRTTITLAFVVVVVSMVNDNFRLCFFSHSPLRRLLLLLFRCFNQVEHFSSSSSSRCFAVSVSGRASENERTWIRVITNEGHSTHIHTHRILSLSLFSSYLYQSQRKQNDILTLFYLFFTDQFNRFETKHTSIIIITTIIPF